LLIEKSTQDAVNLMNKNTEALTQRTNQFDHKNRIGLLKMMILSIIFASGISAVTSYVIIKQFSKYVEIKSTSTIEIHESKVNVFGGSVKK